MYRIFWVLQSKIFTIPLLKQFHASCVKITSQLSAWTNRDKPSIGFCFWLRWKCGPPDQGACSFVTPQEKRVQIADQMWNLNLFHHIWFPCLRVGHLLHKAQSHVRTPRQGSKFATVNFCFVALAIFWAWSSPMAEIGGLSIRNIIFLFLWGLRQLFTGNVDTKLFYLISSI